jgi:uncharacterized Zn finger protein
MMAKRRSSYDDDFYGYYPPSKPIKTAKGIESKTKRGAFGESWWAKRWIQVLESFDIGGRLQRGRSYARNGQVLNIDIQPGVVTARVQGSAPKPYRVKIQLATLTDDDWGAAIDVMSQQAIFAAKLLAGEIPDDIEKAFQTAKVSLFPTKGNQLITECSCPDYSNPCKHIAAVYYLIGEQFDADPFLIFALRGRTKDQIVDTMRVLRTSSAESTESVGVAIVEEPAQNSIQLVDAMDSYWNTGDLDALRIPVVAPKIRYAVLRRLGASPAKTYDTLEFFYQAITRHVLGKLFEQDPD